MEVRARATNQRATRAHVEGRQGTGEGAEEPTEQTRCRDVKELLAVRQEQRKMKNGLSETAEISHNLLVEVTALRAKLQDAEEKATAAKEEVKRQVQEEYESLVRTLYASESPKSSIDGHQMSMKKEVTSDTSKYRKENLDKRIVLKTKHAPTENDTLSVKDQLQSLQDENSKLQSLICKLRALNNWKITTKEGQLQEKLNNAEKESVQNKKEGLTLKLKAEQEVALLRQELMVARTALSRAQADGNKMKQQLNRQKQLLNEFEHRHSQETRSRQQLDSLQSAKMDQLLEDIEEKQHRLHSLAEEVERSSKLSQLQHNKVKREVKQIRSQALQERKLKLEAFQRVDELQSQLYETELANSQRNTPSGMRKPSGSILSRKSRSQSAASSITAAALLDVTKEEWDILQYLSPTETRKELILQRPKTVPSIYSMPEISDRTSKAILTQLHKLRLGPK